MTKHQSKISTILIGLTLILLLIGLHQVLDHISPDIEGDVWTLMEQGLKIFSAAMIAWVASRFVKVIFWQPYEKRRKRPVPKLFRDLVTFAVLAVTVIYITVWVFGMPVWSITTLGGLLGAGFALALQGPILDFFSGIVLDLEKPYKIGDWVELPSSATGESGVVAKVISRNWRTTSVETILKRIVVVPNSLLTQNAFVNYSRPGEFYMDMIKIGLDQDVPLDRGERVIRGAAQSVPEIAALGDCSAYAESTDSGGVNYVLVYPVPDYSQWRKYRHLVQAAVTSHLHDIGLKISESIGEYALSRAAPLQLATPINFTDVSHHVDLIQTLSDKEQSFLKDRAIRHQFPAGDAIIMEGDSGDSMFIIGEGSVVVTKKKGKSGETILAHLGPGQFFGDMALLLGEKRSATVRAKTDVVVFEITKASLLPIMKKRPDIAKGLSQIVAMRQMATKKTLAADQSKLDAEAEKLSQKLVKDIKQFFGL
ncbi:MAG: mechanosensitive ion channel family protein [Alphaproteobacteria bacterium]